MRVRACDYERRDSNHENAKNKNNRNARTVELLLEPGERKVARAAVLVVFEIDIRALTHEPKRQQIEALLDERVQRRLAAIVLRVDVGAVRDQNLEHLFLTLGGGQVQRRVFAIKVARIHVHAGVDQLFDKTGLAFGCTDSDQAHISVHVFRRTSGFEEFVLIHRDFVFAKQSI